MIEKIDNLEWLLSYDLSSPYNPMKVLFHADKINEIICGKIPFPVTVELDLSSACNQSCTHCCFDSEHQTSAYLDFDRIKPIFKELAEGGTKGIELAGGGEPTLNKDIPNFVSEAALSGLEVSLVTNGYFLERIFSVAEKFTFVRVSIDAATNSIYKKIHGKDHLKKVLNNIKELRNYMDSHKIGIGFLVTAENYFEIEEAAFMAKNLGVRYIAYRPVLDHLNQPVSFWKTAEELISHAKQKYVSETLQVLGSMGSRWEHSMAPRRYQGSCYGSLLTAVIQADGTVPFCFLKRNKHSEYIGTVYSEGFSSVWFGKEHKNMIGKSDVQKCPKICKADCYNIVVNAQRYNLLHSNFV